MSTTYRSAGLARRTDSLTSSAIRDLLALTARDDVIGLAGGLPATDLIPVDRIAAAAEAVLRRPDAVQYCETPATALCVASLRPGNRSCAGECPFRSGPSS